MKKITISVDEKLLEHLEWYGEEGVPHLDVDPNYRLEDMGQIRFGVFEKSKGVGDVIIAMAQAYMDLCDSYAELQMYENDEEDDEDEYEEEGEDEDE